MCIYSKIAPFNYLYKKHNTPFISLTLHSKLLNVKIPNQFFGQQYLNWRFVFFMIHSTFHIVTLYLTTFSIG